jgi:hypothetical protein
VGSGIAVVEEHGGIVVEHIDPSKLGRCGFQKGDHISLFPHIRTHEDSTPPFLPNLFGDIDSTRNIYVCRDDQGAFTCKTVGHSTA